MTAWETEVREHVAAFLVASGWYENDGFWRREDGIEPFPAAEPGATIGAAFDWQLAKDGVGQANC